jgi:hypothetical protein
MEVAGFKARCRKTVARCGWCVPLVWHREAIHYACDCDRVLGTSGSRVSSSLEHAASLRVWNLLSLCSHTLHFWC